MMKTRTYAEVALLVGPFTQADVVEVPARGEKGIEFLKEKFGDTLIALVFFDIKETDFQGLKFTSEPHNMERVDIVAKEDVEKRLVAERQELSNALGGVIAALTGEEETAAPAGRVLH